MDNKDDIHLFNCDHYFNPDHPSGLFVQNKDNYAFRCLPPNKEVVIAN